MLYPVIGSSIKFNLLIIPKIFISMHPTAVGSVDGERKLPMERTSRLLKKVRLASDSFPHALVLCCESIFSGGFCSAARPN